MRDPASESKTSRPEVTVEPLPKEAFARAAGWMSQPETNRWLASGWRGREVDERTIALASARNRLFLVRAGGEPCGLVCLGNLDKRDRTATLWYVLGEERFAGQGVTTRAVAGVVRRGFEELNLRSISASVMAPNTASHKILEKVGFRRAGCLRKGLELDGEFVDRLLYDLLPEDLDMPSLYCLRG